jgi:CheY-like chemotaxis protein
LTASWDVALVSCPFKKDLLSLTILADVRVTLPLLHDMPKTADSSSSNPKSVASVPREPDEAINKLRAHVLGRKVALHGFDIDSPDPILCEMYRLLRASVTNFLTNWYGLQIVPLSNRTNIIISNEANPNTISKLARQAASIHRNSPAILVLCSQHSRFDRNISPSDSKCKVGFVAKPVGPLKLARAIAQCLEGAPPLGTPGSLEGPVGSPGSNDLSNVFEELSISAHGGELLDNSRMAADSDNARKAIESPTPNAIADKHAEFPFPTPDDRPKAHSMPASKDGLQPITASENPPLASLTLSSMENAATFSQPSDQRPDRRYAPSLLLVDDNKINLKLLTTFMRKKKYPVVDEAENGLEAVNKFQEREQGYDIIFMDISMPILDGFGATKQIRAVERSRRMKAAAESSKLASKSRDGSDDSKSDPDAPGTKTPSLVIALTGLASGRDQQEAATVGIDIFLTKPVSFKEVGKLLDNWEANRERDAKGFDKS